MSEAVLRQLLELFRQENVPAVVFSYLALRAVPDNISQELLEEVLAALVDAATEDALNVAVDFTHQYFLNPQEPQACGEALLFRLVTAERFFCQNLDTMTAYHWYAVAAGLRERCPDQDLALLSVMLSHPEALSRGHSSYSPAHIADAIVQAHPQEAWSIISTWLESDTPDSSWMTMWLGDAWGFNERSQPGTIRHFDPDIIMAWLLDSPDPERRAHKLLRCLPKTLGEEGSKLTRLFLDVFGDHQDIANSLMGHFQAGAWTGPESVYLSEKRTQARRWVSQCTSGRVLAWVARYIEFLNSSITDAELREERGF
jgi:hypothetical protein